MSKNKESNPGSELMPNLLNNPRLAGEQLFKILERTTKDIQLDFDKSDKENALNALNALDKMLNEKISKDSFYYTDMEDIIKKDYIKDNIIQDIKKVTNNGSDVSKEIKDIIEKNENYKSGFKEPITTEREVIQKIYYKMNEPNVNVEMTKDLKNRMLEILDLQYVYSSIKQKVKNNGISENTDYKNLIKKGFLKRQEMRKENNIKEDKLDIARRFLNNLGDYDNEKIIKIKTAITDKFKQQENKPGLFTRIGRWLKEKWYRKTITNINTNIESLGFEEFVTKRFSKDANKNLILEDLKKSRLLTRIKPIEQEIDNYEYEAAKEVFNKKNLSTELNSYGEWGEKLRNTLIREGKDKGKDSLALVKQNIESAIENLPSGTNAKAPQKKESAIEGSIKEISKQEGKSLQKQGLLSKQGSNNGSEPPHAKPHTKTEHSY
ncbi:MAG: hypothetical protein K9G11_01240 [Rickettsiaceae bacterium]|nr:hypothetical protein [Rickettsiaceae bacterium]